MKKIGHISATHTEAERWDERQYAQMTPRERVDAVEFFREQCLVVAGISGIPRIQKTGRIISTNYEAAS